MNDEKLRTAYQAHLESRAGHRADCVAPEELLALVDGTASPEQRMRVLRHVAGCAACRSELDLMRSAGSAAEHAVAAPLLRNPRALAAATVLVFIGAVAIWQASRGAPNLPRTGASNSVQLIAPSEDAAVAAPVKLIWSALPAARRYEVEILRPGGDVVFTSTTSDTTLVVPANALAAGGDYRWWVVAVLPEGSRPSPTRRLRTTP